MKTGKSSMLATVPVPIHDHRIGGQIANTALRIPDRHPEGIGPWQMEADKVAWIDPATGLECIIRRSNRGGHLCGYVAVGPDHPLFGFDTAAVAALGVSSHGRLSHAKPCERRRPDSISASRVRQGAVGPAVTNRNAASPAEHDPSWWIGFSCDHPADLQPKIGGAGVENRAARGGMAVVYRDEAYVFAHVVDLAAQLHAIGRDVDLPSPGAPSPPPLGLDPRCVKVPQ
jgi:hypothetical protein